VSASEVDEDFLSIDLRFKEDELPYGNDDDDGGGGGDDDGTLRATVVDVPVDDAAGDGVNPLGPLFLVAPSKHERKTPHKSWFKGALPHIHYAGAEFPSNPLQIHNK
jgi:hypothetical protein